MNNDLAQQAITAALAANWEEAVKLNKLILRKNKINIDALNRLARAYSELGDLERAKKNAKRALKIDKYNNIATKSLEKWENLKGISIVKTTPTSSSSEMFLEEAGKTKILKLLNLGAKDKVLNNLDTGDEVTLAIRGHRACLITLNGAYVGRLPDDIASRLKKLIKYGNEYNAHIKSIDKEEVCVFLRETKRVKELEDIPSFSTDKVNYIAFTPPELVHDKSEIKKSLNKEEDE